MATTAKKAQPKTAYLLGFQYSGNCNFQYFTGLRNYEKNSEMALFHALSRATVDLDGYPNGYAYRKPESGMYLFARDSDSELTYARGLADLINSLELGVASEHIAKNPRHNNRNGILYVWIINTEACEKWWKENKERLELA